MKMPKSEIADRLSITMLKHERTANNLFEEMYSYWDALSDTDTVPYDILDYVKKLKDVNGQIWDLEADIRAGKEGELGLEEVGRRAIKIRELNKQRVSIKNEMVEKYNEGFKDIKVNHGSE